MPHVKGILLETTVRGIQGALGAGSLTRDALEAALEPRDLALLEEKLDPTRWYPVASIANLAELLAAQVDAPREEALRRLGAGAVEILRNAGTYQQLQFEPGCLVPGDAVQLRSIGRLIASMWPAMYDFGSTRVEPVADEVAILLHFEALGDCPRAVRHTIEGFTARVGALVSDGALAATYPECPAERIVVRLR